MIRTFKNQGTEDIFNGKSTKDARQICPVSVWRQASRKLDMIDSASNVNDLRSPPGNHLEKLKGNRSGQYSIRINEQYRICFTWLNEPREVEITNYH